MRREAALSVTPAEASGILPKVFHLLGSCHQCCDAIVGHLLCRTGAGSAEGLPASIKPKERYFELRTRAAYSKVVFYLPAGMLSVLLGPIASCLLCRAGAGSARLWWLLLLFGGTSCSVAWWRQLWGQLRPVMTLCAVVWYVCACVVGWLWL